jgi:hypothetical protein
MDSGFMGLASRFIQDGGTAATGSLFNNLVTVFFAILTMAGMWQVFVKAGQPGWAAIVPFYNLYVLLQIVGRPTSWMILLLIPFANLIFLILLLVDLAKSFGKDGWYGLGLTFLPFTFFPMLGFGDAQYVGPAAAEAAPAV